MRRLTIRVNDAEPNIGAWLSNQSNVSASLRLLIQQAARLDQGDYVMHCANQVGTPLQQQAGTSYVLDEVQSNTSTPDQQQTNAVDGLPATDVGMGETPEQWTDEPEVVSEPMVSDVSPEQQVQQPQAVPVLPDEDEDEDDDDSDLLTSRLLADARRGPNRGGNLGSSIEDMMINQSQF